VYKPPEAKGGRLDNKLSHRVNPHPTKTGGKNFIKENIKGAKPTSPDLNIELIEDEDDQ
jgi:hypothetical protein